MPLNLPAAYLDHGRPVCVLIAAAGRRSTRTSRLIENRSPRKNPRAPFNVLVRRLDGTYAVRPFRGLRAVHFGARDLHGNVT